MFNPKNFAITVPTPQMTTWVYHTNDEPDTVEQPGYFDSAGLDQNVRRLDLVIVTALASNRRPAVAHFSVHEAERKSVRLFRTTPWVRPGAAPGADLPSEEDDILDRIVDVISRMTNRYMTNSGTPRRDILAGRLGFMPSPELVDKAVSILQDRRLRERDAEAEMAEAKQEARFARRQELQEERDAAAAAIDTQRAAEPDVQFDTADMPEPSVKMADDPVGEPPPEPRNDDLGF